MPRSRRDRARWSRSATNPGARSPAISGGAHRLPLGQLSALAAPEDPAGIRAGHLARPCRSRQRAGRSKARLNDSAIHPEGGTVGRGGQRAAHVSHQIGHLFGRREPLQERRRTYSLEKLRFKFCKRFAAAKLSRKFLHTGGTRWTGQHRIHRDCCAGTRLGKAARNSKLRGLRHAVMDHLGGGIDRALAADENDTSPVPLLHAWQIRTAQAHAAEHVYLEKPPPSLIGNILKRLWLEDAEVVHENIHEREPLKQRLGRRRRGEIAREAF